MQDENKADRVHLQGLTHINHILVPVSCLHNSLYRSCSTLAKFLHFSYTTYLPSLIMSIRLDFDAFARLGIEL